MADPEPEDEAIPFDPLDPDPDPDPDPDASDPPETPCGPQSNLFQKSTTPSFPNPSFLPL